MTTPDGIDWYVEQFPPTTEATPDPIILIPSGEGDCGNLQKLGTLLASSGYRAISFDNPGFSRTQAPKEAYEYITPQLFADQIIGLLDKLDVKKAFFFGNSSGGCAVLSIAALYPDRVRCGIVHEVPLEAFPLFAEVTAKSDEDAADWCEYFFANHFIEQDENDGRRKWDALGAEYHARLKGNYVRWVRSLLNHFEGETGDLVTTEVLKNVPIFWTVGGMSQREHWGKDFEVADKAGITVRTDVLHCLHFPYVSIPERLRDWIVENVEQTKAS